MTEKARNKNKEARLLLISTGFFWFSMYTYPAFLTPYLTELGASLTWSGIIVSSYGLTQTLARLPLGILSDRLGNKSRFIKLGLVVALVSSAGLYFTTNLYLILFFRALAGLAAASWVQFTVLYLSYYPADRAVRASGQINSANNLGTVSAMLLGGLLVQPLGWPAAFLAGSIGAALGLGLAWRLPQDQAPEPAQATSLRQALAIGRDKLLLRSALLALLLQFCAFATASGFVPQYASQLGASQAQLGLLAALSTLVRALASLLGGSLLARLMKPRSLVALGFGLLGLATSALPYLESLPLLFISQAIGGIGIGLIFTLLTALCLGNIAQARRGAAMGFFQAVYGLGMVGGPLFVGFLADRFSLASSFSAVGLITLLTAVLAWFILPGRT